MRVRRLLLFASAWAVCLGMAALAGAMALFSCSFGPGDGARTVLASILSTDVAFIVFCAAAVFPQTGRRER